jgi:hypothetical protein
MRGRFSVKNAILGVLLTIAAGLPLSAFQLSDDDLGPPAPPAEVGPRISFDQLTHDWGTVLQGTKVEHTYRFSNTGSSVLRITNVKPG